MVDTNRRRLTVGRADPSAQLAGIRQGGLPSTLASWLQTQSEEVEWYKTLKCIHSVTDAELKKTKGFTEKQLVSFPETSASGSKLELDQLFLKCKKGLKPESPNQDSYVVIQQPGKWGLYGVFDGHGPNGHTVSDFAVKTLVSDFLQFENFNDNAGEAFKSAFSSCQTKIEAINSTKKDEMDSSSSGSTCTMTFYDIEKDKLTIAHVGDSRAVVYSGTEVPLAVVHETEDHKPNLPAEKARIEAKGGRVVFDGYYNYRVFAKAGMYPGLNMSRALGDVTAHKEAGLTAEPEIKEVELKQSRKPDANLFLVIASDGVWEFIKSEDAPKVLAGGDKKKVTLCEDSCQMLAQKSWDSWMEDSDNEISDDITVIAMSL